MPKEFKDSMIFGWVSGIGLYEELNINKRKLMQTQRGFQDLSNDGGICRARLL